MYAFIRLKHDIAVVFLFSQLKFCHAANKEKNFIFSIKGLKYQQKYDIINKNKERNYGKAYY